MKIYKKRGCIKWEEAWEKVLQVKEKKIKRPVIKLVEDVGTIHIIVGKDIVRVVVLGGQQNYGSLPGVIGIDLLMEKNLFINRNSNPDSIFNRIHCISYTR